MGQATNEDLKRVYDKMETADQKNNDKIEELKAELNRHIREICGHMAELNTSTAVMSEKFIAINKQMENLPPVPEQPCEGLKEHLEDHKKLKEGWSRPIIVGVVVTFFLFVHEPIKHFFKLIFGG